MISETNHIQQSHKPSECLCLEDNVYANNHLLLLYIVSFHNLSQRLNTDSLVALTNDKVLSRS